MSKRNNPFAALMRAHLSLFQPVALLVSENELRKYFTVIVSFTGLLLLLSPLYGVILLS